MLDFGSSPKVVDDLFKNICTVYWLIFVTAGRPLESAQSERKSTTRYGDEP
ncbi:MULTISPECIES: hypothetical protein [unclassified Lysinibacillus]|uniref:hypothetical protein n=1 Tax=unclassified Lysinibacillus TaxID=2636778 RepID=UPI002554BCBF|nr:MULTISPECIES: hypothetical protein [unclassified Lysinibacillus]MDM5249854.1 hypothetical protein [Lysinibacillus sp. G4S2]